MSRMRGKPNLPDDLSPKDPTDFLDGASADVAEKPKRIVKKTPIESREVTPPVATVSKIFRLRWDIAMALENAAHNESRPGHRVTQTEIVEKLLKQYLNIDH